MFLELDESDLNNYQPFFRDPDIHKWSINQHYNRNMIWYSHGPRSPVEQFMRAKMMLRDFIAQWDKDYAYNKGKTRLMEQSAQKEFYSPLPNNFNVKAITDDGTIVNKHNIQKIKKIFPKNCIPYEIGFISKNTSRVKITKSLKW